MLVRHNLDKFSYIRFKFFLHLLQRYLFISILSLLFFDVIPFSLRNVMVALQWYFFNLKKRSCQFTNPTFDDFNALDFFFMFNREVVKAY